MHTHFETTATGTCPSHLHAALGRPAEPTFFVRVPLPFELPGAVELERYLHRWVVGHLSGWLQLRVLEELGRGAVHWSQDVALPLVHFALQNRAAPEGGTRVFAVRSSDQRGPRRPGLWAASCVAHALAERLGGEVIDARHSAAVFGPRAWSRPPADGRVHVINHLRIPSSRGPLRRKWLSTVGMAQFGLPDLELEELEGEAAQRGAQLLLGVAQHLIDSRAVLPRGESERREVLLTVGELHWALGGERGSQPLSTGRGWTRVALEREGLGHWPQRLRLGPPVGARGWRNKAAWLGDAWRDLFGRETGY